MTTMPQSFIPSVMLEDPLLNHLVTGLTIKDITKEAEIGIVIMSRYSHTVCTSYY